MSQNSLYVDPNTVNKSRYTGASQTLAAISRAQWDDWKARFEPRLQQLANYAQSGELTQQSVGLAQDAVNQSFANSAAAQQRRSEGLGIQMTQSQKAASDRTLGLTKAAATTAAMNKARIAGEDRDMQILAGGSGISSNLTG